MRATFGEHVRQAIARHLGVGAEEIDGSLRIREDLGLQPLDIVLIALAVEDVVSASFPVEDLDQPRTVGELAEFLWRSEAVRRAPSNPPSMAPPPPGARGPRRSHESGIRCLDVTRLPRRARDG